MLLKDRVLDFFKDLKTAFVEESEYCFFVIQKTHIFRILTVDASSLFEER
jgi:hypothetical protein